MKTFVRPTALCLLVGLALLLGSGAGSATSASPAAERGLYLALGDSISAGLGASIPDKSFVHLYYGYLESNGSGVTDLINVSTPGWTTADLRRQLAGSIVPSIDASSDTKAVTIEIGINDVFGLGQNPGCPSPNAAGCPLTDNLRTILGAVNTALAADPGDETVQVVEYYNPDIGTARETSTRELLLGSDGKIDCSGSGTARGLNDVIHCVGIELGATPVDVLPVFDSAGPAFIAPDGIHPTDAGHLAIANALGGAAAPTPPPPPPPPPPPAQACVVPNVKGKTLAAAKKAVRGAHCSVGAVSRAFSGKVKRGRVISEHPHAGARLPRGGKVSLVVSRGPKG